MKVVRILFCIALVGVVISLKGYKGFSSISQQNSTVSYNTMCQNKKKLEISRLVTNIDNMERNIELDMEQLNKMLDDPNCDKNKIKRQKQVLSQELMSYTNKLNELKKKKGTKDVVKDCDERIKDANRMLKEIRRLS